LAADPAPRGTPAAAAFAEPREGPVEHLCTVACAIALFAMVVVVASEVLARNLFDYSFQVSDELGGYIVVTITFVSLAVGQVTHSYHQVDFLRGRLPRRGRIALDIFFDLVSLAACAVLVWQLGRYDLNSWDSGDVAPTVLLTPLWLPQLAMPLGAAALTFSVARTTWAAVRRLRMRP
jgi:TRAP-type C4-dicarboxylate transport system permease small subunit